MERLMARKTAAQLAVELRERWTRALPKRLRTPPPPPPPPPPPFDPHCIPKQYAARILRIYGLGRDDFARMWERQKGCCAICRDPLERPFVDHCHRTGKTRELLCTRCNSGIGLFKDCPQRLSRAIAYLQQHGENSDATKVA
jgi:hypothetical protein